MGFFRLFGKNIPAPGPETPLTMEERRIPANSDESTTTTGQEVVVVYDPVPLRWYDPRIHRESSNDRSSKKRKQEKSDSSCWNKRQRMVEVRIQGNVHNLPLPSLQDLPFIHEMFPDSGMVPIFLYRKFIEKSDVNDNLNRLLLSKSEDLMNFLNDAEREDVMSGKGVDVSSMDSLGRGYTLHMVKWASQKIPSFIRHPWKKIRENNHVKAGDIIEIWGYRTEQEPFFIINFRTSC